MIEKIELEIFLQKKVAIGVGHDIIQGRLFFYFGRLIHISQDDVKLKTKNGFKIIPIGEIRDIHRTG